MSDAEDFGGCGCLVVLGLLACGVLYPVYALYDGYYSRELPVDQTALIEAKAHISTSANKRVLDITLENNSEWIITEISTKISVSLGCNLIAELEDTRKFTAAPLPAAPATSPRPSEPCPAAQFVGRVS